MKNLVIVESPAKAKTIGQFLGSDYTVKSSFGHIRDLPKKGLNIDIPNGFEPTYEISQDKKKIIAELRKAAKDREVWLASDEDREGEAIAWHLAQALRLDPAKTKRIVFHEITRQAIEHAIKHPRTIDIDLVNAQQARRVLDRLVGYELSPVLWKKVRTGLSAGRVQSVTVRLVVDREREIRQFEAQSSFKISARLATAGKDTLDAQLQTRLPNIETARDWLEKARTAVYTVGDITRKPAERSPGAPFTTSSLQQEAARRLGFSVKQTMTVAQRLYESGRITYMRTDSTTLSGLAIKKAEEYILEHYGSEYHQRRQFQTKNQSAQEAHEAIRPTDFATEEAGEDATSRKLYALIWQRALSSQMKPARLERTEISVALSSLPDILVAKGEVLLFDGFLRVYGGGKQDTLLPRVATGDRLDMLELTAAETFSRPPARYSEASLVRKLEELGIGRPSTYAPTISTVQSRGYVEKTDLEGTARSIRTLTANTTGIHEKTDQEITGADRGKLVPTHIAEVTTDFLTKYFPDIVDYDFTARVENDFDQVAAGEQSWQKMIAAFYQDFHPQVEQTSSVSRHEVSQARLVGNDPATQLPIYARYGRYGPMLQRGEVEDETRKPDFAALPPDTTIDTVTLEQALSMFQLPRTVGSTEAGEDIIANIGRYGPYLQVGKTYVSIKGTDPRIIGIDDARRIWQEHREQAAKKTIQHFASNIKVLQGPYGPYVTDGKKNVKIPKDQDPAKLTEDQCKALLAAAPAKKPFRGRKRAAK